MIFVLYQGKAFMCEYGLNVMGKICDECNQQLNDDSDLAVHLQQYHRKSFCAPCRKEFNSPTDLKEHVKNAHGVNHDI